MPKTFFLILISLCFCMPTLAQQSTIATGLGRGAENTPVDEWPVAEPLALGLDTTALRAHANLCEASAATACLVAYKGHIVQEWKQPDYDYGPYVGIASATKSITGLLVGMLVSDGKISSVDAPVAQYIPEWQAGVDSSVTIRHLLTMTSGLGRLSPMESVLIAKNTTDFVLGLPLSRSPGERWEYSNEGVQLLSPILERAAKMPLAAYARERLLGPIGMQWSHMFVDEYYNTVTFGGAEVTLRDFAKLGQLVLNKGRWNGQQIIPADWIEALSTPTPQNKYYGFLWWLDEDGDAIVAAGDGDRILIVMPEHDLVAVRVQRIASIPGTFTTTYFNDRGRMHGAALDILREVVPDPTSGGTD